MYDATLPGGGLACSATASGHERCSLTTYGDCFTEIFTGKADFKFLLRKEASEDQ